MWDPQRGKEGIWDPQGGEGRDLGSAGREGGDLGSAGREGRDLGSASMASRAPPAMGGAGLAITPIIRRSKESSLCKHSYLHDLLCLILKLKENS